MISYKEVLLWSTLAMSSLIAGRVGVAPGSSKLDAHDPERNEWWHVSALGPNQEKRIATNVYESFDFERQGSRLPVERRD